MLAESIGTIRLPVQSLRIMSDFLVAAGMDPNRLIKAAGIDPADRVLRPLRRRLPDLRIVLEHVTTLDGVEFVRDAARHLGREEGVVGIGVAAAHDGDGALRGVEPDRPVPQVGQAPLPCEPSTRSATTICSSREA